MLRYILFLIIIPLISFDVQCTEPTPEPISIPTRPIMVSILNYQFEGNTVIDTKTLLRLTKNYVENNFKNTNLTFDDMQSIANYVTLVYREQGYIVAQAYLPQQDIENNTLKIVINEGYIEDIIVLGNSYYDEKLIRRFFQPQLKQNVINEFSLEQSLLYVNSLPSCDTSILLNKGERKGYVDILLKTKDEIPIGFGVDYNNYGSKMVSENRYGLSFNVTDPKAGATLSLRAISGDMPSKSFLGNAGLSIPIRYQGTKLSLSFIKSTAALGQELAILDIEGTTEIYDATLSHDFFKTKNTTFSLSLSVQRKLSETKLRDTVNAIDELNVYSSEINFDHLDGFLGQSVANLGFHYATMDKHSSNYIKSFERISFHFARIQNIYGLTNAIIKTSGQYTGKRLASTEKISIGGYDSVRGHEASLFLGDTGLITSLEINFPIPFVDEAQTLFEQRLGQLIQFGLFYDYGMVTEDRQTTKWSENIGGGGINMKIFYKNMLTCRLDVGLPSKRFEKEKSSYVYMMFSFSM